MANENVTATNALIGLQGQLDTVRSEVFSTNIGLQNIATLIQNDSFLDQQRLFEEREQEKLLADREIALEQQEELQRRVSAAVEQPVAQVEQKLNSTFSRITDALKYLFTGFLGTQVLKGLKGFADLGIKTLSGIGSLLRNSFGLIWSGLSSLKGGFGSVINSIVGVTNKVSKGIIALATSPFKKIADIFKKLLPGLKPSGSPKGLGIVGTGLTLLGGGLDLTSGQNIDAALAATSILAPPPIRIASGLMYGADALTEMFGGNIFGKSPNTTNSESGFNFNLDPSKMFSQGISLPSFPKIDFSSMKESVSNFFNVNLDAPAKEVQGQVERGNTQTSTSKTTPIPLKVEPFQPTKPPSQKQNIPPTPEAKPDIVYLSTGQNGGQSAVVSPETRVITDVPLIPSSNPDNFYTLYAQVNYNVVM